MTQPLTAKKEISCMTYFAPASTCHNPNVFPSVSMHIAKYPHPGTVIIGYPMFRASSPAHAARKAEVAGLIPRLDKILRPKGRSIVPYGACTGCISKAAV